LILVAGLGVTGQSVLSFLHTKKENCIAFDTRANFDVRSLEISYPNIPIFIEKLPKNMAERVSKIILSPGIAVNSPWLSSFKEKKIPIIGDIELFATLADKPIISITGSNGKSTVTSLVTEVLNEAGYQVGMGGNIGVPVLDLLNDQKTYDVYVLELSSFQLETTYSLHSVSATILNICEDHMDRYDSFDDYVTAKKRIFKHAETIVLPDFYKQAYNVENAVFFGGSQLLLNNQPIMPVEEMALQGKHHLLNAQATIALTKYFNISAVDYKTVFQRYKGLAHRTQTVLIHNEVEWVNDSKGTNVGATLTAIKTLSSKANGLILIAGGVGKGADFSPLKKAVHEYCKQVILFGRDANLINDCLNYSHTYQVNNLAEAIKQAAIEAESGDIVLFSPACASFDQYKNYEERGDVFECLVKKECDV